VKTAVFQVLSISSSSDHPMLYGIDTEEVVKEYMKKNKIWLLAYCEWEGQR
jgi:hypothetical protein